MSDALDAQPGWSDEDLLATALANFGVGSDADLPDAARFLKNVTQGLRERLVAADSETRPSVFFLAPAGPSGYTLTRQPLLLHGQVELGGNLWFVGPTGQDGRGLSLDDWDDAQIFARAEGELGIGSVPAVLFDPRPTEARVVFYPDGLETDGHSVSLDTNVTLDQVFREIDLIYEKALKSPHGHTGRKIWKDAAKLEPVDRAEVAVQSYLHYGLSLRFPTCTVRQELADIDGRLDIIILEPQTTTPGGFVVRVLLELKVLTAKTTHGNDVPDADIRTRIEQGVTQAHSYGRTQKALASALCCFDMRRNDTGQACFSHVTSRAAQLKVALRAWFLHHEAVGVRNANAAAALNP